MAVRKFRHLDCRAYAPFGQLSTGAAATGADATVTQIVAGGYRLQIYNSGVNTTNIFPVCIEDANCTNGWNMPSTNTDNVGFQMTVHAGAALDDPNNVAVFTDGTDPAFYMKAKIGIPDVSDYDVFFVGFVEPAAYVATAALTTTAHCLAAYDEKAGIALRDNAGDLGVFTSLNNVDVDSNITDVAWLDDTVKILEVRVSAAGVVTCYIDSVEVVGMTAFTFANGTLVTPWIMMVKCANVADTPPILNYLEWGYQ